MTSLVALKLILTPLLITVATLTARRWGGLAGGMIAGLPLTSGPVSFFLAVEHGANFAASAAAGTILGLIAVAGFAVAYAWSARRLWIAGSLAIGVGSYGLAIASLAALPRISLIPAVFGTGAVIAVALRIFPPTAPDRSGAARPRWDLPARAVIATAMVLLLTASARWLAPELVGLLSPFPVFAAVLAAFSHAHDGPAGAVELLRGVLIASFGFLAFFVAIALLVTHGIAFGYAIALIAALAANLIAAKLLAPTWSRHSIVEPRR